MMGSKHVMLVAVLAVVSVNALQGAVAGPQLLDNEVLPRILNTIVRPIPEFGQLGNGVAASASAEARNAASGFHTLISDLRNNLKEINIPRYNILRRFGDILPLDLVGHGLVNQGLPLDLVDHGLVNQGLPLDLVGHGLVNQGLVGHGLAKHESAASSAASAASTVTGTAGAIPNLPQVQPRLYRSVPEVGNVDNNGAPATVGFEN